MHRILDYEQVYNITEGTFAEAATNFKVAEILEQVQGVTENDFRKRNLTLRTRVDQSAPRTIRASHLMFRQVVLNLLATTVAGSVRNSVDIVASGTLDGRNLQVEIKSHRNELSNQQRQRIEELCLEEELVRILEAVQQTDVNLIIALILSRQLGWPIDFSHDDASLTFVLIVPTQAFGSSTAAPTATPRGVTGSNDIVSPK